MTRLIIGCGYLGRRVARRWLSQGCRVLATTRGRGDDLLGQEVEPLRCDVTVRDSLCILPRAETVLYCVGFDRNSGLSMEKVYVEGLANVLDHLPPPGKFLYVSSTSVYGQLKGEEVDEEMSAQPVEESGKIVLRGEEVLREKLPGAIILRFAGIYGPGRLLRQKAVARGEPLAVNPDRWLNLIQVEDGVGAVLAAEENGRPGRVYNVSDGRPVRRRDFFTLLSHLLGAPEPRFVPSTGPPSPHDLSNRRIRNGRLLGDLKYHLLYPSYVEGLKESVGKSPEGNLLNTEN